MRTLVLIIALMLTASGCYTYSPISVDTVTPEMIVRIELASEQQAERLEGQVFEVEGQAFSILPEVRPGEDRGPRTLEFSDVRTITQRTLHTGRTLAVLGAGIATGIGVLLIAEGEPGSTGNPPGGPGDFDLIPVLRTLLGSR